MDVVCWFGGLAYMMLRWLCCRLSSGSPESLRVT
jgi:hypothetical protein